MIFFFAKDTSHTFAATVANICHAILCERWL